MLLRSGIKRNIIICIHSWWQDIPICVMIKLWAKRPVFLYEKNLLTVEGTDCCEHRDVSQTTEEKIPWEGEFTIRSDPWAGLIASCGSFYPMVRCYLLLDTNRLSSTSLISNFCSSSSQDRYVQEHHNPAHPGGFTLRQEPVIPARFLVPKDRNAPDAEPLTINRSEERSRAITCWKE